ncbi:MAG: glycerol kinase GlpK [Candidatus Latescibacteria bacterium]|jgi:glycerol kinase|nr:glycerol kinase GlpK [Candidatus Latescibacterota bacterium]
MILSIDQGTTGTRAIVFDRDGGIVTQAYAEFPQHYPKPGWVSHNPVEIWDSTCAVVGQALGDLGARGGGIAGIGITNQRETTVIWDRATGEPVHDAIVWQCRRTADLCRRYREQGLSDVVAEKTGLIIDPYFSATKIVWLLENVEGLRSRAESGEVCFGTVDTYLLYRLTCGAVHATDLTNASRTMCLNIHTRQWDPELLDAFGVPEAILPAVHPSAFDFGTTAGTELPVPAGIPIAGIAGDQQSALFGQRGVAAGDLKNTYGTGCFALFHTGPETVASQNGLLTTLACDPEVGAACALEGSVFSAGAAVQWLRDGLGIIRQADETEALASSVEDTGDIYLVPAFTGLGSPHWDPDARGTLVGITRGTERAHLVRAALESIAYQTADLVDAMAADAGRPVIELRVDGGAVVNDFLMQFQADILGAPVVRPRCTETTALGAAMLAGLRSGFWKDPEALAGINPPERVFEPAMSDDRRQNLLAGWHRAVATARSHARSH